MGSVRLNITLNQEAITALNTLCKELKMSKSEIISNAILDRQKQDYIARRKALWLQTYKEIAKDKEFQKEQRELADWGAEDGVE